MKVCKICGGKYHAKGLCIKHYGKKWKKENPEKVKKYRKLYKLKHRKLKEKSESNYVFKDKCTIKKRSKLGRALKFYSKYLNEKKGSINKLIETGEFIKGNKNE